MGGHLYTIIACLGLWPGHGNALNTRGSTVRALLQDRWAAAFANLLHFMEKEERKARWYVRRDLRR